MPPQHEPMEAAAAACSRIAPAWPLDQFIAVNPWWERIDAPITGCAARLAALSGATLLMPREFFKQKWRDGTIGQTDLLAALREEKWPVSEAELFAYLDGKPLTSRMQLMTHVMDGRRDLAHNMAWETEVTHQISQFCAAVFDRGQAAWRMEAPEGLYPAWLERVRHERGIGLLMGARGIERVFGLLPDNPADLIADALAALHIPAGRQAGYLEALLLSLNGWASWCAYLRWQDRLAGRDQPDQPIVHLLAIRLAWEWVLYRHAGDGGMAQSWAAAVRAWEPLEQAHLADQRRGWIWQHALEIAFQERLVAQLTQPVPHAGKPVEPLVKAYFCIDVRSEVFRRALEAVDPRIQTGGFAGFFGLPVAYRPAGLDLDRPQLPGLLAPTGTVHDCHAGGARACAHLGARRRRRLLGGRAADTFRSAGTAVFSFVESAGLFYGYKLVKDGLFGSGMAPVAAGLKAAESRALSPRLQFCGDDAGRAGAQLAARVLRAMSLTGNYPPLVLLAGHGGRSENNPHAAGLDCGACCGQTGEVNARALAALLNDPGVRGRLREHECIDIPDTTWFVAGLHNTTTDELELFDLDGLPAGALRHAGQLQDWLARAGEAARAGRAARLGVAAPGRRGLLPAFRRRSRDWSQVRPEWALANNASFIVAPRARTRHIDLQGRAFLHDYDWRADEGFKVLELIMTAPMVVAHWINLQYYASTVDNHRYGSGNKVLHNVVGGSIGVFEGNGGDLRTGLPIQSLHDGRDWMHEPLRLSVFIEAPRHAIDRVIAAHETVRQLVHNGWLHLFQLDGGEYPVYRYPGKEWRS